MRICMPESGPRLNIKTALLSMQISITVIKRPCDRLIFNMGIPILVRQHLFISLYWDSPRVSKEEQVIASHRSTDIVSYNFSSLPLNLILAPDDVIRWKHFPRHWPFVWGIHRSMVNSPHKGQWRGVLMFSLICAWINGWVNNRKAGDLRRYRVHCDVIVMSIFQLIGPSEMWEPFSKSNAQTLCSSLGICPLATEPIFNFYIAYILMWYHMSVTA